MESNMKEKLTALGMRCQSLQQNGKHLECIDILEQMLAIKKQLFGIEHPQFERASQKLCEELNLASMVYLQKEQFTTSLDLLKKAELVAQSSQTFKATTYNNLACYYRRTGKLRTALSYLIQALQLQIQLDKPHSLADTHLNLCAVMSQLDRHQDALQHALLSVVLIQQQFLLEMLPKLSPEARMSERLSVLAIAYHNLGVQLQHNKRGQQAVKVYAKALNITKQYLPQKQMLLKNLSKVLSSAQQQLSAQPKKRIQVKNQRNIYNDLSRQFRVRNSNLANINLNTTGQNFGRRKLVSKREDRPKEAESRQFQQREDSKRYQSFVARRDRGTVKRSFDPRRQESDL